MTDEDKRHLGIMTNTELDRAIQILGPQIVFSIKRMSLRQLENFEEKIQKLIENKKNSSELWYRPMTVEAQHE